MTQGTLVLTCEGPLQSWGASGRFNRRDTHVRPTLSGVLGMISCAAGQKRGERPLISVAEIDFVVRDDRPGPTMFDYHTVGGGHTEDFPDRMHRNTVGKKLGSAVLTTRAYLQDAAFTVMLMAEMSLLQTAAVALENPVWQPSLGRRSCPPTAPLLTGLSLAGPEMIYAALPVLAVNPADAEPLKLSVASARFSTRANEIADIPAVAIGRRTFDRRVEGVKTIRVPSEMCRGTGPEAWHNRKSFMEAL